MSRNPKATVRFFEERTERPRSDGGPGKVTRVRLMVEKSWSTDGIPQSVVSVATEQDVNDYYTELKAFKEPGVIAPVIEE